MKIKVDGTEYDLSRLMVSEAEAIEKVTGQKMQDALASGTATSIKALVWVAQKRVNPELAFRDVDFALESVEVIDESAGSDEDPTQPPQEESEIVATAI